MIPFLFHIPIAFWLVYQLYQQEKYLPLRSFFWAGWIAKTLAGIGLGLLYLYYYPYKGDTFALFHESTILSREAFLHPSAYLKILLLNQFSSEELVASLRFVEQPRALFMAKLLSLLNLFTFHNYWITGFYASLFSFWGMWRLANRLVQWIPGSHLAAGLAFLLFPSVVVWSSGVLKETLTMGFLCSGLATILAIKKERIYLSQLSLVVRMLYVLVCGGLVWKLKFYYLAVWIPVAAGGLLALGIQKKYQVVQPSVLLLIQVLWLSVSLLLVGLGISYMLEQAVLESMVSNYETIADLSKPGKYVSFESLRATPDSFFRHFPVALWSGWFAPLPWQALDWLSWGVSLENVCLVGLTLSYSLSLFRKKPTLPLSSPHISLVVAEQAVWMYVMLLAVILAFTAPNFGTLSRYKVGFLPFWVYVLVHGIKSGTHRQVQADE